MSINQKIKKEAAIGTAEGSAPSAEEMKLINAYTRRELLPDDVYVFSVVLCDNEVDRDGERFTVEALFALEKLFVGKTGIFDHNPSAKNQTARIFSCAVEAVPGRKTATGDDYFRLKARAYIPKTKGNAEIIEAIEGGIMKEVSIGCAVEKTVCSICGESINTCQHRKGEKYGARLCCGELLYPYDAYEFSFVAVPSQRQAGVIKSAYGKEDSMEGILKRLEKNQSVTLSNHDCEKLTNYIEKLKLSAKDGAFFRDSLTNEVLRLSAIIQPEISRETMESVAKRMTVGQLTEFKTAFEKKMNDGILPEPQLYSDKSKHTAVTNGQFTI